MIVCYKKIYPVLNDYILDYRKQALSALNDAMAMRQSLEERLNKILDSEHEFRQHISMIDEKYLHDLNTLNKTYEQRVETLRTEKQTGVSIRCERYKKMLENKMKAQIAEEFNADLTVFFQDAKKTQNFNSNTIEKAVEFVQNHLS
ncbi:MAG: hypothetical protein Q8K36_05980 [Alphaproteobacteria bacterium]|nr:hypothetical protein [Alphaproteobacteria bacterium]